MMPALGPIQIWTPAGDRWVRPAAGLYGDHYSATPVLHRRQAGGQQRVVLVGESVATGYLYAPHYTPAKALATLVPQWDVIDLARTNESLASLRETVAAAMQLEPDVVVMWAGNNWMLRDLGHLSPYHPDSHKRPELARLLADDGLEAVAPTTRKWVRAHVLPLLNEIQQTVARAGSRLAVVVPEVNLFDWEHGQPVTVLPEGNESSWYRALAAGDHEAMRAHDRGSNAVTHRIAAAAEPAHVGTGALRQEVDASCGPLRGTTSSPMATKQVQDLLREWAADHALPIVDVPAEIERAGDRPDRGWFLDYCHHTAPAIATIAESIARALDVDHLGTHEPVPGELQAVAALGALIHTDHRLATSTDRRPLLRHWRLEAAKVWPAADTLARDLIDSRLGSAPVPLTEAQRRNLRRPFPFGFAHGWRPHTTEADALWALGITQADAEQLELPIERAWPNARIWRPGEQRWTDEQPFTHNIGFLRSIVPRSHFGALARGGQPLQVELTARVPNSGETESTVAFGSWSTTIVLLSSWTTHCFTIPPDVMAPGLHPFTITWPELPEGRDRWNAALTDMADDRMPDLHPVFGEVFSLKVS